MRVYHAKVGRRALKTNDVIAQRASELAPQTDPPNQSLKWVVALERAQAAVSAQKLNKQNAQESN